MTGERFRYWSNGTEGHEWFANWCARCSHDHAFSHTAEMDGNGCEVYRRLLVADDHRTIPELVHDAATEGYCGGGVACVMFERCQRCFPDEGGPRKPPPPDPNQGLLFEMPEHVLMYRDVVLDAMPERAS
jgi:hypothetical protein